MKRYAVCRFQHENDPVAQRNECERFLIATRTANESAFQAACSRERVLTPGNGMRNYDPARHASPFWFSPLGTLWKRAGAGAPLVAAAECTPLAVAAVRCHAAPYTTNAECREMAHRATVCSAGVACPALQAPLLQCVLEADRVGEEAAADAVEAMRALSACTGAIVEYRRCSNV